MENEFIILDIEPTGIVTFTTDKSKIGTSKITNGITEKFIYCGHDENDKPKDCYDKLFNIHKYQDITIAEKNNDVYTVKLKGNKFIVLCPNGKIKHLKLLYQPICGVDALDDSRLCKFIDKLILTKDKIEDK